MYVQNNVTYFNYFGVEHTPKERNIFRIQEYDSIMCRYFRIGFLDFMHAQKSVTQFTNLFSRNNFKRNEDIILKYFMTNV